MDNSQVPVRRTAAENGGQIKDVREFPEVVNTAYEVKKDGNILRNCVERWNSGVSGKGSNPIKPVLPVRW